jgi:two-component system, OmpR family, sensor histidine kinase CiaH
MATFLKIKSLKTLFIIYWVLLAYIIAALVWWFISLEQQNRVLTAFKQREANNGRMDYFELRDKINAEKDRRTAQYIGEGVTFFLLIIAGAVFVFRAVRRELKLSRQQQNFMMAITHELKTPIAITKLNLETLQKRKLPEEVQEKFISNALQETNRLNDLCNNLLLTGQFEAGRYEVTKEKIDLSELVNTSVNEYSRRFPERKINIDVPDAIYIRGDKLLLQMAINNLLDNAIKYSPEDKPIGVELLQKDNLIKFIVKDMGKGIPEQEREKVFSKFYRIGNQYTKEAKGTGLGLYLTSTIVKQHNGHIIIKGNSPSGCIFEISFASA